MHTATATVRMSLAFGAWLIILLMNEVAVALVYAIAAALGLFFLSGCG